MDRSGFFEAVEKGDVQQVTQLLDRQPELLRAKTSPSYAPERPPDCTALHAAIYARRGEVARLLVDAGIDIEVRT
jgi:hypothetical protein